MQVKERSYFMFDFGTGPHDYWNISGIWDSMRLQDQYGKLTEELFDVKFNSEYIE